MIKKQVSAAELADLLKSENVFSDRPGLAKHILNGGAVFETNGTQYALRASEASHRMLTKEAPGSELVTREAAARLTGEAADQRIADFERVRLAKTASAPPAQRSAPSAPAAEQRTPQRNGNAADFHSEATRRASLSDEKQAELDADTMIRNLFDGPEAA